MKKKLLLIIFLLLITIILIILLILLTSSKSSLIQQKEKEISLPKTGKIEEYIQAKLADIDDDKAKELIAIYHDDASEGYYQVFFVIFELENGQWKQILEQQLEAFSVLDKTESPTKAGQYRNQFELVDLNNDQVNEVLVKTRASGSGMWFGIHLFGLQDGKIEKITSQGPIPQGNAGTEKGKIWILSPEYGPDDPNCCPSIWYKTWFTWDGTNFKQLKEIQDTDLETIRKKEYNEE